MISCARRSDEVREAFQGDGVAVAHQLGDRLPQLYYLSHVESLPASVVSSCIQCGPRAGSARTRVPPLRTICRIFSHDAPTSLLLLALAKLFWSLYAVCPRPIKRPGNTMRDGAQACDKRYSAGMGHWHISRRPAASLRYMRPRSRTLRLISPPTLSRSRPLRRGHLLSLQDAEGPLEKMGLPPVADVPFGGVPEAWQRSRSPRASRVRPRFDRGFEKRPSTRALNYPSPSRPPSTSRSPGYVPFERPSLAADSLGNILRPRSRAKRLHVPRRDRKPRAGRRDPGRYGDLRLGVRDDEVPRSGLGNGP